MIGDVLTSAMLFEPLRKKFPNAELHYLVNSHTLPVVENNPFIDKLVLFTPEMEQSKLVFFQFLKKIRREKYNVIIDVYSKWSSALISFFSGTEKRIGKKKWYLRWAYTDNISLSAPKKESQIPQAFINRFDFLKPVLDEIDYQTKPKIFLSETEKTEVKKKLEKQGLSENLIMVNCLGSGPSKTYPLKYLASLLDKLVGNFPKKKLILNAMPSQKKEVDRLISFCSEKTKSAISGFRPEGLREFIVTTSFCDAVIGNEGGAINMAKALDIPTFAIFSPWIDLKAWGHQNEPLHVNIHLKVYEPELFEGKDKEQLKANAMDLYEGFKPELFQEKLKAFLGKIQKH
jgi:heptosyltransferase-2